MKQEKESPLLLLRIFITVAFLSIFGKPQIVFGAGWEWQNPFPCGNGIIGIWGSSGTDVFAVGWNGTIIHYDGSSWSSMNSGTIYDLHDIWGSSGGFVQ